MASILKRIPFGLRLWDMSDGDKYTTDDDNTTLTPELAASDEATDKAYKERFRQEPNKGNGGKGKSQFKVEKEQLHTDTQPRVTGERPTGKEIDER